MRVLFLQDAHFLYVMNKPVTKPESTTALEQLLKERIVVLDGAMGTTIQQLKLTEADVRGREFANVRSKELIRNNELLVISKPDTIENIHSRFF